MNAKPVAHHIWIKDCLKTAQELLIGALQFGDYDTALKLKEGIQHYKNRIQRGDNIEHTF